MIKARHILVVLWATLPGLPRAQSVGEWPFTPPSIQLSTKNGLSSNQVNCLAEDGEGFLWVGTDKGLNRCDGQEVLQFRHEPKSHNSLTSNDILCIEKTSDGQLWIGTNDGVLHQLDPQTLKIARHEVLGDASGSPINRILQEGDSVLWLAAEARLGRFSRATGQFRFWTTRQWVPPGLPANTASIYSLSHDPKDPDLLWLGLRGGLFVFRKKTGRWEQVPFAERERQEVMGNLDMHFDETGTLWLAGSNYSLFRYQPQAKQMAVFQTDTTYRLSFRRILPKSETQLWVASVLLGLGVFDKQTGQFHFGRKPGNGTDWGNVWALEQGRSGVLWAGTDEGVFGILPKKEQAKHFFLQPEGTAVPKFFFCQTLQTLPDGRMLMGENSGSGLWLLDSNGVVLRRTPPLPKSLFQKYPWATIYDLHDLPAENGSLPRVVAAANAGLLELDWPNFRLLPAKLQLGQAGTSGLPPNVLGRVHRILDDKKRGCGWLLTSQPRQLVRVNWSDFSAKIYPCGAEGHTANGDLSRQPALVSMTDICLAPDGHVWIAGVPDILRFDPATERFEPVRTSALHGAPASNLINCLAADQQGRIWLGHEGAGLDCYDPSAPEGRRWRNFRPADGLPTEKMLMMKPDADGNIWIATSSGLVRFDPRQYKSGEELQSGFFEVWDETAGLLETNLGKLWRYSIEPQADGRVFVGGLGFFTLLKAAATPPVLEKKTSSSLIVTGLKIADQERFYEKRLASPSELRLEWWENFFTITVADLDWGNYPHKGFEYRLVGFDTDWQLTRTGRAPYTNVPPGSYVFRFRKAGDDGEGTALRLYVTAPFWQTGWFYFLLAVAVGGMLWSAYAYRVRHIRREEAIKATFREKLAQTEMMALRSQMNPHFIFNALNSIKSYLARNERREATDYLSKFAHLIRLILNNSKSPAISLENELEALKLYVELEQMRFSGKFHYSVGIGEGVEPSQLQMPPLVLQPLVENAIWHGLMHMPGPGRLDVRILKNGGVLQIEVEDNGVGRQQAALLNSKALQQKSFGMQITQERLDQFYGGKARLEVFDKTDESGQPAGTRVVLHIPFINLQHVHPHHHH